MFVAHRALGSKAAFVPLANSTVDSKQMLVTASNLTTLDREWVILAVL